MARTFITALVFMAVLLSVAGCGSPEGRGAASHQEEKSAETPDRPGGAKNVSRASQGSGKLSDIRDAEAEGKNYPTASPPDRMAAVFREPLPGATARECVTVSREGPTRSGEVVTQIFYLNDEATGEFGAKMPWTPLHLRKEYFANGGEVSGVTVRVASLEESAKIKVHEFSRTAGLAELGVSYPSHVPLPGKGPWRMIATSGPDWGCFDLKPPGRAA